jgi:hypothetical protein
LLGISVVGIEMDPLPIVVREIELSEPRQVPAIIGRDVLAHAEFTYTGGSGKEPDKFRLAFPEPPAERGLTVLE